MADGLYLQYDKENEKRIQDSLKSLYKANQEKGVFAFGLIGEKITNLARNQKTYQDQTSNLINSTGYVLVENSNVERKDFGTGEGAKIGLDIALENKSSNKEEIQLIIDAGMEYAEELESKGYKVISFALPNITQMAKDIEKMFKK